MCPWLARICWRRSTGFFTYRFFIQVVRFHKEFERYFYMKIMVTIIPTDLVSNLLLSSFYPILQTRVQLIFLKNCCKNLSFCKLIMLKWIKMNRYSPTNFPSPKDNMFLTVTENKFIVWNYPFPGPICICLFEFSNIVQHMFKVNTKSTRQLFWCLYC